MSGAQWSPERLEVLATLLDRRDYEAADALRAFARVLEMADGKPIIGVVVADDEDDTVSLADALDVTPPRREVGGAATAAPDGLRGRQPERPRSSRKAHGSAPLLPDPDRLQHGGS